MPRIQVHLAEIELDDFVTELMKDEQGLAQIGHALIPYILQEPLVARAIAFALLHDPAWLNVVTDEIANRLEESGAITFPAIPITEADREDYPKWLERHFGFDRNLARRIKRSGLTLEEVLSLDEQALAGYYGISRKLAQRIVSVRPKTRRTSTPYPEPVIQVKRMQAVPREFSFSHAYGWYKYWWKLSNATATVLAERKYTPDQLSGTFEQLIALTDIGNSRAREIMRRRRSV